jgi:thiol-disulfide isomerase/thioredoxin
MMTHSKIHFILFLLLVNIYSFGQNSKDYRINGTLSNAEGQKIYLIKRGEMKFDYEKTIYIDSAIVKNDKFIFTGKTKESIIPLMNDAADSSMAADNRGDSLLAKKFADSNQLFAKKMYEKDRLFITTHPKAFISLYILNDGYKNFGFKNSKKLFNNFSNSLKNHSLGRQVKYKIFEGEQMTLLNSKAIIFSQTDTSGIEIPLSFFKGKYLLIDFWASWCGPCRAENPNIKNAYKKYKSKGFEILGVSLDNDKTAWINAIIKDSLTWTNVSDLKGWKNNVAQKYVVSAVPASYLLDKEGKIIAKDLRGESLTKKLTELFEQ